MQQVTIRPRSSYRHLIHVNGGDDIHWQFTSSKKNISFGVFRKKTVKPANTPGSPMLARAVQRETSSKSLDINTAKKSRFQWDTSEMVEVVPIAHYKSSQMTIRGHHLAQETGIYVIVFDNSFSQNTSKKVTFMVTARPQEDEPVQNHHQGWILKKGNRKLQGYFKRWLIIDQNGVLVYSKLPGGVHRGSVDLNLTEVHINPDQLQFDIDSGESLYHFKAQSKQDFDHWVSLLEKYSHVQAHHRHTRAPLSQEPSIQDVTTLMSVIELKQLRVNFDKDFQILKNGLLSVAGLIDSYRATNKDDFSGSDTLFQIDALIKASVTTAESISKSMEKYDQSKSHAEKQQETILKETEEALHAAIADNNHLRGKLGADPVTVIDFVRVEKKSSREKKHSVVSGMFEDVFFDAIEGEFSDESDDESADLDSGEILETPEESEDDALDQSQTSTFMSSREPGHVSSRMTSKGLEPIKSAVVRRKRLPAPAVSSESISLMSILRNNVGKDLSTVAMPIALNEPLNLLQRLCEELEYCELLDAAAKYGDPVDRLVLMSAFAVSAYASTLTRAARKPFNPLLGETFEYVCEEKGFRFVSEKVSHHPPIMACHAESPSFVFFQDNQVKSKFWGKSMELIPSGTIHVLLKGYDEEYVWTKVVSCMRNLFSSSRCIEHYGKTKLVNKKTGHYCELTFKEAGMFSSSKNDVAGEIFDENGKYVCSLSGKWHESVAKFVKSNPNNLQVIWKARPVPPHHADMYGFSAFAVQLNELTEDIKEYLPNTDTRFRPDQRLYEEGNAEAADAEKTRLEQRQREYRKQLSDAGQSWTPQWFVSVELTDRFEVDNSTMNGRAWRFNDKYWMMRGQFQKVIDLW